MSNSSDREKFCLSWSQFVPSMVATLRNLHDSEDSKDVTLISDDGVEVKCHRFILNSTSGFFKKLFSKGGHHKDPIVYLTHISSTDLKNILKFMYFGQVFLEQHSLNSFMSAANKLTVQGLSDHHQVTAPDVDKLAPMEHIVKYDYQRPQMLSLPDTPSTTTIGSNKGVIYDPIEVIQQQTKQEFDPMQDLIDELSIKKENVSPRDGDPSMPVLDVVIPQLNSEAGSSENNDPISLQFLDWNRGVDNEYVVTSADSSVQSTEQKYYQCEKCEYKSTKMFNVKKHTAAVHDGVRYPCKFCDYKATETGHLRKHVRARHGKHLDHSTSQ